MVTHGTMKVHDWRWMITEQRAAVVTRLLISGLVGAALSSSPWLASKADVEGLGLSCVNLLMLPGLIVAMSVSRNVHDYSLPVVLSVSALFYAWITYLCLRAFHKR
jgi:hypothetical protein